MLWYREETRTFITAVNCRDQDEIKYMSWPAVMHGGTWPLSSAPKMMIRWGDPPPPVQSYSPQILTCVLHFLSWFSNSSFTFPLTEKSCIQTSRLVLSALLVFLLVSSAFLPKTETNQFLSESKCENESRSGIHMYTNEVMICLSLSEYPVSVSFLCLCSTLSLHNLSLCHIFKFDCCRWLNVLGWGLPCSKLHTMAVHLGYLLSPILLPMARWDLTHVAFPALISTSVTNTHDVVVFLWPLNLRSDFRTAQT